MLNFTIESHSSGGFVDRAELDEGEVLVQVYLTHQHWVARGLSQIAQVHLEGQINKMAKFNSFSKNGIKQYQTLLLPKIVSMVQ